MRNLIAVMMFSLFATGCASLGEGARIRMDTTGFTFNRSWVNVYNNAGPLTTIQPFSRGDGFVAEYKLGKRNPWCLGLCRKKIPTKLVVLKHGESFAIPLHNNLTGQYIQQTISLKVISKNKIVGTYSYCVTMPPNYSIVHDVHFGPRELQRLKEGDPGEPCGYWRW